jgi:hypothetical protein
LPHHNPDFQPPTGAAWRLMRGKMSISTMGGIAAIGWLQIHRHFARQQAKFWEKITGSGYLDT